MSAPQDQAARTRFETDVKRNAVVEAGAGTGKTTLVVARILALVTGSSGEAPVPIERIGAMTFTEAAAAELAARVADGLAKARLEALDAGDETRARDLGDAYANLGSASISTIHGFTQRILRDHAIEAGLDPSFEILPAIARQRLVEEVFELWFDEVSAEPAVRRALSFGIGLGKIETLARDLVDLGPEALETTVPELPQLEGAGGLIQARLQEASRLLEELGSALEPPSASGLPDELQSGRLYSLLRASSDLLLDHTPLLDGEGDPDQWEAFELELMKPRWEKGVPGGGGAGEGKWATAFGGSGADYKEKFLSLRDGFVELREAIGGRIALDLTEVLGSFRAHFEDEKTRRAVVDFDDLLVRAERLVRTNAGVRQLVMQRFETLFVDEFQDTDPVQARLVFFLAGGEDSIHETDWTRIVPAPGRLVLVGDPKQSIYRFRKADVETYRRCCRAVAEADPDSAYTITTNFRTDGALVDYVNRAFEDGPAKMVAPDDGDYQADYMGLVAHHAGEGHATPVLALVQDDDEAAAGAAKNLDVEAASLARFLAEKIGSRAEYRGGEEQPLGFGDVAVLGRTRASLEVYADALAAEGISYVFEGGGALFEAREVLEALTLLTAIVESGRETAVVGALRSVWLGASDDQLASHRMLGGGWDPNAAGEAPGDPVVRAHMQQLVKWGCLAREEGPEALIEHLLGHAGMGGLMFLRPSGPQALMDLVRLRSLLLGLIHDEGLGLAAAVRFAGRLVRSGSDEKGARIAAQGAVRLMTVHASKGLEFGMVVLAQPSRKKKNEGGDTKPWLDDGEVIVSLGKGYRHPRFDALIKKEKLRADAERLRLYYVALTRAKHFLVVPVFAARGSGEGDPKPVHERIKSGAFGAYLGDEFATGESYVETVGVAQLQAPEATPPDVDVQREAELVGSLAERLQSVVARQPEAERREALEQRPAARPFAFGPSTVADHVHGQDVGEHADASADQFEDAGERARQLGTFVHLAIELRLSAAEAEDRARSEGFEPGDVSFIGGCVATEASLESHTRAFALGNRVLDEAPILWGNVPGAQKLRMNGFIDRLILFEDGSVEIVDFKTDRFDASDAAVLAEHTDHHMVQLGLYGLALEAAGLRVAKLTLAYVAAGCDDSRPFDADLRQRSTNALCNLPTQVR